MMGQTMSVYHASHHGASDESTYVGKGFGLPDHFQLNATPQFYYMNGQRPLQQIAISVPETTPPLLHSAPRTQGKDRCHCGRKRNWLGLVILGALAATFIAGRYTRRP